MKKEKISKKIRERRIEMGYSYEKLSELTGISSSSLNRYETGHIKNISIDKFEILANVLKLNPSDLLEEYIQESKNDSSIKDNPYFVDTSVLTATELEEFNRVTGVNKQLFFNDVDEEHDMALFKQAVVDLLVKKRENKK